MSSLRCFTHHHALFDGKRRGWGGWAEAWERAKPSKATPEDLRDSWLPVAAQFMQISVFHWDLRYLRTAKQSIVTLFFFFFFLDISDYGPGGMDPLLPPEMDREADGDGRRKIQFSVPSPLTTQLDPRQVEMVSVCVRVCVCVYLCVCVWGGGVQLWVTLVLTFWHQGGRERERERCCYISSLSRLKDSAFSDVCVQ